MPIYKYTIPLERTENSFEPAYDYPEENEINRYEKGRHRIVIQEGVIPHFHKDSIAVKVDVLVEDEDEWEQKSP